MRVIPLDKFSVINESVPFKTHLFRFANCTSYRFFFGRSWDWKSQT